MRFTTDLKWSGLVPSLAVLVGVTTTQAAVINSKGSDNSSQASFSTGANWTVNAAPSAGNDYVILTGHTIRTVADATSRTFGGDSLTVKGGLLLRANSGTVTTTVNNMTIDGGELLIATNGATQGVTTTFAGAISIASGGAGLATNWGSVGGNSTVGVNLTASLAGEGPLHISHAATTGNPYTFAPSLLGSTTRSGTTTITGNANASYKLNVAVGAGTSLGSGDVNILPGANGALTVHFNNASTLADDITLTLGSLAQQVTASNLSLNLNFTGGDTIGSLSYNGTLYTSGKYGSAAANALDSSIVVLPGFTGTGHVAVVPEPASAVALLAAGLLLRRKR